LFDANALILQSCELGDALYHKMNSLRRYSFRRSFELKDLNEKCRGSCGMGIEDELGRDCVDMWRNVMALPE